MEQLSFRVEAFEGPLDLLLTLIKKNKVNIYDIPISEILEQYLEVIAQMEALDLEISSEFLVLAATLLQIKSRMLLPAEDEEEEGEDPREELVRRLVEYKRFKEKAEYLRGRENLGYTRFYKAPEYIERPVVPFDYSTVSVQNLLISYKVSYMKLERKLPPPKKSFEGIVGHEKISVKSRVSNIWKKLIKTGKTKFLELFRRIKSRPEAVASFLAVLELIKLKKVAVEGDMDNLEITRIAQDEEISLDMIED
ncbi:MAG: segregation/condensation protein A [Clostridia bacterium]|nr:segregation/condensation protein A [Clostridia bacterium]